MKTMERRTLAVCGLEIRGASGADVTLVGYASTFNQRYSMGWHDETVDSDAFKRTLGRKPDVRFLINHQGLPLARTTSGTLTLSADAVGLESQARVNKNDPDVASLLPKVERGDVNQMSFGFGVIEDAWSPDMSLRTMKSLDLDGGDTSVVTYPANPNTTIGIRAAGGWSLEAVSSAIRSLERRNAGEAEIREWLTRMQEAFNGAAPDPVEGDPDPIEPDPAPLLLDEPDPADAARAAAAWLELRKRQIQLLA